MTKIKKDLIHKAKVKKQYAKVKAQEQKKTDSKPKEVSGARAAAPVNHEGEDGDQGESEDDSDGGGSDDDVDAGERLHPTRHLMLKDEEAAQAGVSVQGQVASDGQRRRTRRPGYYDKQLAKAEERRAEAEERAQKMQRRREEREKRLAERERYKKAMAKTRGKDGKKKLGRESTLLLGKVKRMMAEQ